MMSDQGSSGAVGRWATATSVSGGGGLERQCSLVGFGTPHGGHRTVDTARWTPHSAGCGGRKVDGKYEYEPFVRRRPARPIATRSEALTRVRAAGA